MWVQKISNIYYYIHGPWIERYQTIYCVFMFLIWSYWWLIISTSMWQSIVDKGSALFLLEIYLLLLRSLWNLLWTALVLMSLQLSSVPKHSEILAFFTGKICKVRFCSPCWIHTFSPALKSDWSSTNSDGDLLWKLVVLVLWKQRAS